MPKRNRKKVHYSRYLTINNEELEVNADYQKGYGVYVPIIQKTVEQLDACYRIHKRVCVIVFILHHRETSQDNKDISRFMNVIKQWIKRKYKTKNIGSVWVREWEKSKSKSHHYHCALMVDGDVVNDSFTILQAIKSKWFKHGHVPVDKVEVPHYNLRKENYKETRDAIIWRLSYYGKVRGKGYRNPQSSDYQTSRLK